MSGKRKRDDGSNKIDIHVPATAGIRRTIAEIDPEKVQIVLTTIGIGAGRLAAATEAGITRETLNNWIARGKAAIKIDEGKRTARDRFWAEFNALLEKATMRPRVYMLGLIDRAAEGDWRAGAWALSKLYPKEFGDRIDVSARVESETTVRLDISRLSITELRQLKALRAKMGTEENKND